MQLDKFLKGCITNDKSLVNYTKIGNNALNIFGNKYFIPDDMTKTFYEHYKKFVFEEKQDAYLTEKQLDKGKILIDLDFRYDSSVDTKQHTNEHIEDMIEMILNGFNEMFQDIQGKNITFYIFEKESVNQCEDKTKDGIHMMINILCDVATKRILRDYMIAQLPDIWDDLPITNTWNDVVDEGVIKGIVNWQLYGSKKPGNLAYKLKSIYETSMSTDDQSLDIKSINITKIHFDSLFPQLCARDVTFCNHSLTLNEAFHRQHAEYQKDSEHRKMSKTLKRRNTTTCHSLNDVKCKKDIESMIEALFEDQETDYNIKETHQYTMILPDKYWGPGSYNDWIRVGWALKNTSEKLLLTWMLFCSQSPEFDFQHNDAIEYWNNFDTYNKEGLTRQSILYWAKMSDYEEYIKIHRLTIDYYIYNSFRNNTEFDLALTLYSMYKCQYVCSGIQNNVWYEFSNNRWYQIDSGSTLRLKISTDMYKKYTAKLLQYQSTNQAKQNNLMIDAQTTSSATTNTVLSGGSGEDDFGDYKKKVNEMLATCKLLKKTNTKNNIMKEAKDLFWDDDFLNKLDKDPYLLGCNNCIIDFREKKHRKGKHDDYISKSTGLNYMPLSYYQKHSQEIIHDIEEFMKQLFPDIITYDKEHNEIGRDSSLRKYMWEHLASTLLGTNENQTFNIYNGSGANGKSKMVELMSEVLGDYKGTVPITLVTQKRNSIGGTSSEVYNLIGVRYAVMQEPSKGDRINEGIMKELTGGDPIQCRALFKDSITFVPQFKLSVCTNTLFDIPSNDDGTWRRLRKVDFHSKFTETPFKDPRFPVDEYPYQFKIDAKINEKFKTWAPVLLSMLVDIAFQTQGNVHDVESVLSATQEYRQEQDIYLEFHNAYIQPNPSRNGFGIKQQDLMQKFKEWFGKFYAGQTVPNGKEVRKYFEKKYGKYPPNGWMNISYKFEFQNAEEFS